MLLEDAAGKVQSWFAACWAIALSGLARHLLLLKLALAAFVLASLLILLPRIPRSAVQAAVLPTIKIWRRCSAWKKGSATKAGEPSGALPLAGLLDLLLAWLANNRPRRQCDHHSFKVFGFTVSHWLHFKLPNALQHDRQVGFRSSPIVLSCARG